MLLLLVCCWCMGSAGQPGRPATAAQPPLKLLTYNVLTGFQKDPAQAEKFIAWVDSLQPDITALLELSTFTQDSLERLARRFGHPYAVLLTKEKAAPIGITSRYPIINVQKVTDNMHHGYIYAQVLDYHLLVTHLSPFSYDKCMEEMRGILAKTATLPPKGKILITGDLNSFSPADSNFYRQAGLSRRYGVLQQMLDAGFTDAWHARHPQSVMSYPTVKYDNGIKKPGRIDHIFLNPAANRQCVDVRILKDAVTDSLSDHYPLLTSFYRQ